MSSVGFRPDIEGLRAWSILSVVAFHAFNSLVPGGFIGVDVFFVISGFVITQSLLSEWQRTSTIDLVAFWCRRIRRILPASTLVLCAIGLATALSPDLDNRAIGKDLSAAALFFINLRLAARATDYITADHSQNPLLHFWSLAVEEQFYAVWPAVLILILAAARMGGLRRQGQLMVTAIILILVASLAYSLHLAAKQPSVAFFNPFSRGWQLLSGALLAAALPHLSIPSRATATMFSVAGCGLLFGFCLLYSPTMIYPGWLALIPVIGASLLIVAGLNTGTFIFHVLASTPLRLIGRLSFSWYLWHWPVLVFGHLLWGHSVAVTLGLIALSFVLAALTYHFIENPIRYAPALRTSKMRGAALGIVLIALGAGTGSVVRLFAFDNLPLGNGVFVSREGIKRDRPALYDDDCLRGFADGNDRLCVYGAAQGLAVVLFGDSHAGNWFEPLRLAAQKEGWRLYVRIKASCQVSDAPQTVHDAGRTRDYPECAAWQKSVLTELASLKPALIVVGSTSHRFPIESEKRILDRVASIAPTVVMAGTPNLSKDPLDCLKSTGPLDCQRSLNDALPKSRFPSTPRDQLSPQVTVVDMSNAICPNATCQPVLNNRVIMFDKHHLTASFSRTFAPEFEALLKRYRPQ